MNSQQSSRYLFNYPYDEARLLWKGCKTKEDLLNWHLRFTPWFSKELIIKVVEKELMDLNKNIDKI